MTASRKRKLTPTGAGHLYEAFGAWHVRYYAQEIGEGGEMQRVQKSKKLCDNTLPIKEVEIKRQQFMLKINTEKPMEGDMLISAFWQRFIKHCEEVKKDGRPRKRPGTVKQYKSVYKRRLEKHFGKLMLSQYEPEMGSRYLDSLTAKLGLNALRHIKAIANSMFERAVVEGRIKVNPFRGVKLPEDAARYTTKWYTQLEAEQILTALKDRVDAQLAFAIGCYCGLRPGEICALKWEDGDGDWMHVRRSYVRGELDIPKTSSSVAPVVVPPQVRIFLDAWWEKCESPKTGWIFPNRKKSGPVVMANLYLFAVKPALEAAKLQHLWKGWYACRRACATWLIENSHGNGALAQQQLRHKSMSTTLNVYKKAISREGHLSGVLSAFPQLKS